MDEADAANDRIEQEEELRRRAQPVGPEAVATGACLFCEEPTAGRWCDLRCRDDWQARRTMAAKLGRG
jgi:hypothetical protein